MSRVPQRRLDTERCPSCGASVRRPGRGCRDCGYWAGPGAEIERTRGLIAQGLSVAQAAAALRVTPDTVRIRLRRAREGGRAVEAP